ncbi:branched-chain amino acid aminotransferase [Talaromyces proteolyticus]|uniref:Branched-chain amino acid aminotransferase n=1 Tax=Talaromyces proteolyticus TaxID=1131652 RepID=A0AAD4KPR8_9EURO|nr:branched-chain amino acid aminotransferase [Talaromyces proteolyticus]KAH8693933.1 branched-chain amino acid aminotransferase [Talaromyces proteolyticus]
MTTFPPPPKAGIDWNNVGVSFLGVNGHVESDYDYKTGTWSAPQFVEDPYLRIHGLAPGLNYGQQVFEGLKAYRDPNGEIQVFRPTDHAMRLQRSSAAVAIPHIPEDHFWESVNLAIASNAEFAPPHETDAAMYIRPLAFGSDAFLAVAAGPSYKFCVYAQPFSAYHGLAPIKALVLEDFDRAAPLGVGNVKVGGNYAPVLRWSDQARKEGFGITLHLDSKTHSEIDEFSTSGFIGVKRYGEQTTLVVPNSKSIIKSVTSTSAIEVARSMLGWTVEIRPIPYAELPFFDEVLAVGTAAMLAPIRSITRQSTGDIFEYGVSDREPGPACVELTSQLKGIQKGVIPDILRWLRPVTEVEEKQKSNGTVKPAGSKTNGFH